MLVPVVEEYELGNVLTSFIFRANSAYLIDVQPIVDTNWERTKPRSDFLGWHFM